MFGAFSSERSILILRIFLIFRAKNIKSPAKNDLRSINKKLLLFSGSVFFQSGNLLQFINIFLRLKAKQQMLLIHLHQFDP